MAEEIYEWPNTHLSIEVVVAGTNIPKLPLVLRRLEVAHLVRFESPFVASWYVNDESGEEETDIGFVSEEGLLEFVESRAKGDLSLKLVVFQA